LEDHDVAVTLQGADEPQTPPAPPQDSQDSDSSVGLTVEDIDARWRHRVSQKDKAHAAAEAALREENDRLKAQLAQASRPQSNGQSSDGGGNDAYLREQLAQAQREAEQERQLRAIESKRAKYPSLSKAVGADSSIFASDDATLARLDALADDDSGTTFAPTTPRKPVATTPKPLTEMSKAELETVLKQSIERGAQHRR
jgi:hypothetical protein